MEVLFRKCVFLRTKYIICMKFHTSCPHTKPIRDKRQLQILKCHVSSLVPGKCSILITIMFDVTWTAVSVPPQRMPLLLQMSYSHKAKSLNSKHKVGNIWGKGSFFFLNFCTIIFKKILYYYSLSSLFMAFKNVLFMAEIGGGGGGGWWWWWLWYLVPFPNNLCITVKVMQGAYHMYCLLLSCRSLHH